MSHVSYYIRNQKKYKEYRWFKDYYYNAIYTNIAQEIEGLQNKKIISFDAWDLIKDNFDVIKHICPEDIYDEKRLGQYFPAASHFIFDANSKDAIYDIDDLIRFLRENPDYCIIDDEDNQVSLDDFKRLLHVLH